MTSNVYRETSLKMLQTNSYGVEEVSIVRKFNEISDINIFRKLSVLFAYI